MERQKGTFSKGHGGAMKKWLVIGMVIVAAQVFLGPARAQETSTNIQVLQQKELVKYHRGEVAPTFTLALNENLTRHIGVGGQVRYYLSDEWAGGVEYIKYFGSDTDLASEISAFGVAKEKRYMDFYAGAIASWTPILGKFLFFGKGPIHWDFSLTAGLGVTRTGASATHFTGSLGVGFRFLIWRCLTLNLEVRDYMFREHYRAGYEFVNNIVFTSGVSLFVPFRYSYRFPR